MKRPEAGALTMRDLIERDHALDWHDELERRDREREKSGRELRPGEYVEYIEFRGKPR